MRDSQEPIGDSGVDLNEPGGPDRDPAELLAAVRRGDARAFEQIARDHAPRMFRLALRLCRSREEAEDLVQDTLVKALPALRRFEGRARLSTYLVRALGNQWKNRLRSRSRSRVVDWFFGRPRDEQGERAEPDPADSAPSAHERLEAVERAGAVRAALERLEPTRRWTLLLREVEELSYEQIAEVTAVPLGTVRSRIARARRDLRDALEQA